MPTYRTMFATRRYWKCNIRFILIFLPKETVGRVRVVLCEMLTNDDKEDDNKEDANKEDDDKDNKDVHQLITKQRRRM